VLHRGCVTTERAIWRLSDERSDKNHLNALCRSRRGCIVSGFGPRQDESWSSATSGFLRLFETGENILGGLEQPHSVIPVGRQVAFCESRRGVVRLSEGGQSRSLGGYTRGLAKAGNRLFAGVSRGRLWSRSRETVENPAEQGDPFGHCALFSLCLDLSEAVEIADLSHLGQEIYDVVPVPPSMRLPLVSDVAASRAIASKLWTSYERECQRTRERNREISQVASLVSEREAEFAALRAGAERRRIRLQAELNDARAESECWRAALRDREREVEQRSAVQQQLQARVAELEDELERLGLEREAWRMGAGKNGS
jgi:hypothetical protein